MTQPVVNVGFPGSAQQHTLAAQRRQRRKRQRVWHDVHGYAAQATMVPWWDRSGSILTAVMGRGYACRAAGPFGLAARAARPSAQAWTNLRSTPIPDRTKVARHARPGDDIGKDG
jgi:hypothetical protein